MDQICWRCCGEFDHSGDEGEGTIARGSIEYRVYESWYPRPACLYLCSRGRRYVDPVFLVRVY